MLELHIHLLLHNIILLFERIYKSNLITLMHCIFVLFNIRKLAFRNFPPFLAKFSVFENFGIKMQFSELFEIRLLGVRPDRLSQKFHSSPFLFCPAPLQKFLFRFVFTVHLPRKELEFLAIFTFTIRIL